MQLFNESVSLLSNQELIDYSVKLAKHENEVSLKIIDCLREAEKRMLYSELGLNSLWDFATRFLGLSSGNAQMKIDAMRVARDIPVAKAKIESGELSIPNAAKVNRFLRQERKAGKSYTPEEKEEVINSVLGLTQSKCERVLLERSPETIPAEKVRPLTDTKTELKIVLDEKTMTLLERLKDLLSHKLPGATYAQLLDYLAREKIEMLEKKMMGATLAELSNHEADSESQESSTQNRSTSMNKSMNTNISRSEPKFTAPGEVQNPNPTPRKYIAVEDHRWVMRRARGQCEIISENGIRCTSTHRIELDHVIPLFLGGKNERNNYRATCRNHNLYYAKMNLGPMMTRYVPSLK